jgi:hypothetical protein
MRSFSGAGGAALLTVALQPALLVEDPLMEPPATLAERTSTLSFGPVIKPSNDIETSANTICSAMAHSFAALPDERVLLLD